MIKLIKKISKHVFCAVFLLLLSQSALSSQPINTGKIKNVFPIGKNLEIYIETPQEKDQLSVDKLIDNPEKFKFIPSDSGILNYGYSDNIYWLKFIIQDDGYNEQEYTLVNEYPLIGYLDLYLISESDLQKKGEKRYSHFSSGWYLPFSYRGFEYRKPNFKLPLKHGLTYVYVKMQTRSPVNISLNIHSFPSLVSSINHDQFFNGFYIGLILALMLFNIFMYMSLREKSVLLYIFLVLFLLLFYFSYQGYTREYLWPDAPWQIMYTTMTSLGLAIICIILFFIEFMDIKKRPGFKIPRLFMNALAALIGFSTFFLFISFSTGARALIFLGIMVLFVFSIVSVYLFHQGEKYVRFIIAGSMLFLIGAGLGGLHEAGILGNKYFTQSLGAGIIFWIAMISLALTDKYQFLSKKHLVSQRRKILEQKSDKTTLKNVVLDKTKEILSEKNLLESRVKAMEDEFQMAKSIRENMLVNKSFIDNISIYHRSSSTIGGDYLELFTLENDVCGILMANVSGQGIPAVFNTLILKTIILESEETRKNPAELISYVNAFLRRHSIYVYITLFYATYNRKTRNLVFSTAGHVPPFLISGDSLKAIPGERGYAIGAMDNKTMEKAGKSYDNVTLELDPGSKLVVYSAGLLKYFSAISGNQESTDIFGNILKSVNHSSDMASSMISYMESKLKEQDNLNGLSEELSFILLEVS